MKLFKTLWSLFWRACVYGLPLFVMLIIVLALIFVPPVWAFVMCFNSEWLKGFFGFFTWIFFIMLLKNFLKKSKWRPLDRYNDGAV